jgi:hypothetical protein
MKRLRYASFLTALSLVTANALAHPAKDLAIYECGLHGRKVVEAWRRNYNIDGPMMVLRSQLQAQYGEQQGQKVFAVYEAVTAETIAWTEAALARAFAGFTVAEQLPPQEAQRFADRLKSHPAERDRWVERFFVNGWLTQPGSGYGKDHPQASWLYRMKAVQAACAGAFLGAGDIVAGHEGLGYPPGADHPVMKLPFFVR